MKPELLKPEVTSPKHEDEALTLLVLRERRERRIATNFMLGTQLHMLSMSKRWVTRLGFLQRLNDSN